MGKKSLISISLDEDLRKKQIESVDPSLLYANHKTKLGFFFNPWSKNGHIPERARYWRLKFRQEKPGCGFPVDKYQPVDNDYNYLSGSSQNSISFAGHASIVIQLDGSTIMTDPFFSDRAIVKKEVRIDFDFDKVPNGAVVLISHSHPDHLDKYSAKVLAKKNTVFIVPLGLKKFLSKMGVEKIYELDWWQSADINGIKYTLLPSQHTSSRLGQFFNRTLWGSYIIEGSKTILFSGDGGYFMGFREFGKKYSIDYALVGVGPYHPRWFQAYRHMSIDEFFRVVDATKAKIAIPMHIGIIRLSIEHILDPLFEIDAFLDKHPKYKKLVKVMRVGERLTVSEK